MAPQTAAAAVTAAEAVTPLQGRGATEVPINRARQPRRSASLRDVVTRVITRQDSAAVRGGAESSGLFGGLFDEPFLPANLDELRRMRNPLDLARLSTSRPNLVAALVLLTFMGIGGVYFKVTLDITWIQGFYAAVATVTTVGYGDYTPMNGGNRTGEWQTAHARMAVGLLFILASLLVMGTCLGLLVVQARE